MHIFWIFCFILTFCSLESRLKPTPRFVIKGLSLSEKNKIRKQVIFKTSKEAELTALLISMQAMIISGNLFLDEMDSSLWNEITTMNFSADASFKSFETALDHANQTLVFVTSELQDKKMQKKHLRWLYKFFRKQPNKDIYLLKIAPEKKTGPSPLHVFNWMPQKNALPKDYSFGMTTTNSRSSSMEHAFCYL